MVTDSCACVLAAGKGTRMGGDRPKVLFEAGGKPLIEWVLSALSAAGMDDIVCVVGFGRDEVVGMLPTGVRWVEQSPQLGTGHAVMCARSAFAGIDAPLLVTCGDMPLITAATYARMRKLLEDDDAACSLLTVKIPRESRFGRVVRNAAGEVERIVEYKDASEAEQEIDEGNAGVYCFRPSLLWDALDEVRNDNAQGEYYLPDVIPVLLSRGCRIRAEICADPEEALGVNTPADLAAVEKRLGNDE